MSRIGPIIIAEDDVDDQQIMVEVFESLSIKNPIRFFTDGQDVLEYLLTTKEKPFIIISDVNLVRMNGLELRRRITADEKLRRKSIPFVFLTTSTNHLSVM
ncbi:MAG: response regulator, partial [Flavitalea sp.]